MIRACAFGRKLLAGAVLCAAACTVEIQIQDKPCPCADEYQCNTVTERCVSELCSVSAKTFDSPWATPHSLAFSWGPTGDGDRFASYEITIAESKADLDANAGTARTLTKQTNPELGEFASSGEGNNLLAIVGGLKPDTLYYARLKAMDTKVCESISDVVVRSTKPPPPNLDGIVIFETEEFSGYWTPRPQDGALLVQGTGPSAFVAYTPGNDQENCVDGGGGSDASRDLCGQPVKLSDMNLKVGGTDQQAAVRADTFADAYLEITVQYKSRFPANFVKIWLRPNDAPEDFAIGGWVLPFTADPTAVDPGAPITIEIPLGVLQDSEGELAFEDIASTLVNQFGFSAQWHVESTVILQTVQIRH